MISKYVTQTYRNFYLESYSDEVFLNSSVCVNMLKVEKKVEHVSSIFKLKIKKHIKFDFCMGVLVLIK